MAAMRSVGFTPSTPTPSCLAAIDPATCVPWVASSQRHASGSRFGMPLTEQDTDLE